MNPLQLPWLEIALGLALGGAVVVSRLRNPVFAYRGGVLFTGAVFLCALLASLGFYAGEEAASRASADRNLEVAFFGRQFFVTDELNAPLVPLVALLHFLTAAATTRTKKRRYSFSWSLAAESIRLAAFACTDPVGLLVLLALSIGPPYVELRNRGRPTRVYLLHMALFVVLALAALLAFRSDGARAVPTAAASVPLLVALLVRCGTVPAHCWLTDWFEHASFGNALLYVIPLAGVNAVVRLVLPVAPEWLLRFMVIISLVTAVYAAGMATVQGDARRFFAYLFLSHASLVLVGLELHSAVSLTGALSLWLSVILSLGGFGLTLRALEARYGRLTLAGHQGLYDHSPTLAVCFLLTGLATVGFPGTVGFVATEMVVDGAIEVNLSVGLMVVATAALNGIAVMRAYLLLFTGGRHISAVSLRIGLRERFAVLTLAVLILVGGFFPQPGVASRRRAAEEILANRAGPAEAAGAPPATARGAD